MGGAHQVRPSGGKRKGAEAKEDGSFHEFGTLFRTERGDTRKQKMDGRVWFPKFVFTSQTMLVAYPNKIPDAATKKRYYTYFMNMPHMMPEGVYRDAYVAALEEYPVAPFLDTQNDAYRWLHAVCNDVYGRVGHADLVILDGGGEAQGRAGQVLGATRWVQEYLDHYKPSIQSRVALYDDFRRKGKMAVFALVVVLLAILIVYNYV